MSCCGLDYVLLCKGIYDIYVNTVVKTMKLSIYSLIWDFFGILRQLQI
jgi:hypothetical protein